jgi:hypothetical protein
LNKEPVCPDLRPRENFKCEILSRWPVNNVKTGTIQQQKIKKRLRINWSLRNIVLFAGVIQIIKRLNNPVGRVFLKVK